MLLTVSGGFMKFLMIVVLASLAVPILANASDSRDLSIQMADHLIPLQVEVSDVTEAYQNNSRFSLEEANITGWSLPSPLDQVSGELDKADILVDKIINIGTKVWTVLEKGQPVANFNQQRATAVPQNIRSWQQLEGWNSPQAKYYQILYKNVYGFEVAKLVYKIIYLTGGTYKGTGKYIGFVSVEPQEFKTAYLYTFNVQAAVESVFNKGTSTHPLAGMIINIKWTVSTLFMKETQSYSYHIDGQGAFQAL